MTTEFELEMMQRLYADGFHSLRVWVQTGTNGGTQCSIHWVAEGKKARTEHAAILDRFTWNGELDHPRRAVICAIDRLSQLLDTLPPMGVRPPSNTANEDNSD